MKKLFLFWLVPLSTGLALLAGCASGPTQPSAQAPPIRQAATASQPILRPAQKDLLQAAAAKAALPFEGEGWQPMFDGKTLTERPEAALKMESRPGAMVTSKTR